MSHADACRNIWRLLITKRVISVVFIFDVGVPSVGSFEEAACLYSWSRGMLSRLAFRQGEQNGHDSGLYGTGGGIRENNIWCSGMHIL